MVSGSLAALAEAVKQAARQPRARKAALELTDAAAERVRRLLEQRHKVRGCSQYSGRYASASLHRCGS